MKKVCVNPKNYNLTEEKEYEIIAELERFVSVINDKGLVRSYSAELFKEVKAEEELTLEDVNWTIFYEYDDAELALSFSLGTEKVEKTVQLGGGLIAGNCGIVHIDGINDIYQTILDALKEDFGLYEVDEYEVDEKALVIFKDCIGEISEVVEEIRKAMVVFSTNDTFPEIWKALDDLTDLATVTLTNPNSYNEIKMWIKYLV